jgi:hypothetical protein
MAELDQWFLRSERSERLEGLDREQGLGALPEGSPVRPRRRTASPALAGVAVTALILSGVVLVGPGDEMATVRRLLGLGSDRYGSPPAFTPGEGTYKFLLTQRGSDRPVAYDPCRRVEYAVNPAGAPEDWKELVDTAVAHTEWATGLDFVDVGPTEERPFNPTRSGPFGGAAPRPVVIGFADSEEIRDLAGDVAGLGGSVSTRDTLGRDYFVTGAIALDTDVFRTPSDGAQRTNLQAIVDHEFGHVVGLDHVDDPSELMYESNVGVTDYGPGDLEGMARLGSVPCR